MREYTVSECYGSNRNFHGATCPTGGRSLITRLDFGAKNFTEKDNLTCPDSAAQTDKDVCCSSDAESCLFEIEDFAERYKYLDEFSGRKNRSRSIIVSWHQVPSDCHSVRQFSNFVQILYTCIPGNIAVCFTNVNKKYL